MQSERNNHKIVYIILTGAVALTMVVSSAYAIFIPSQVIAPEIVSDQASSTEDDIVDKAADILNASSTVKLVDGGKIPEKYFLSVPFQSQAPLGDWDELHNEACEEAVLIMAKYWLNGQNLDAQTMDDEILKTVGWEMEKLGGHYDLPTDRVLQLAKEYFEFKNVRVVKEVNSVEIIKKEVAAGRLVLLPTAGRLLNNPYFRQPGPVYHFLVAVGYKKDGLIVNDPGTKRGKNFYYSNSNILESLHNWPLIFGAPFDKDQAAQEILKGAKNIVVIEK
jgi:hypothetical protein